MRQLRIFALYLVLGSASGLWASNATPAETLAELEQQVNGRALAALVGQVDFDYLFTQEGVDAWALETVRRKQREVPVQADSLRALKARLAALESQVAENGKARVDTVLRAMLAQELQRLTATRAVPSFLADTTNPDVQSYLGLIRAPNDRRGDPERFDLTGVDARTLEQHPRPARLKDREDVVLCVQVARPEPVEAPIVTQIVAEHPLPERRVMRLDLRTFYTSWSPDTSWELEVEELEVKDDAAVAQVRWSFSDQPEAQPPGKQQARLALRQTPDGWRIERCWTLLEQVMASRR